MRHGSGGGGSRYRADPLTPGRTWLAGERRWSQRGERDKWNNPHRSAPDDLLAAPPFVRVRNTAVPWRDQRRPWPHHHLLAQKAIGLEVWRSSAAGTKETGGMKGCKLSRGLVSLGAAAGGDAGAWGSSASDSPQEGSWNQRSKVIRNRTGGKPLPQRWSSAICSWPLLVEQNQSSLTLIIATVSCRAGNDFKAFHDDVLCIDAEDPLLFYCFSSL